jgi:glycosyltransferase involved in cell wall biosynthesis
MPTADVAVIVPVYNRQHVVCDTLNSVVAQTLLPICLIIVDDGSTDETASVVQEWIQKQPDTLSIVYAYQENAGVSAARNYGLCLAPPTEYVAFLDSDDVWPADFLERTCIAIQTNASAAAAITSQKWPIDWWRPRRSLRRLIGTIASTLHMNRFIRRIRPDYLPNNTRFLPREPVRWMIRHGAAISSCSLFRRAPIETLGGFDESLRTGEDAALYIPLSLQGTWQYAPGLPVLRKVNPAKYGDAPSLSRLYTDNFRRWACAYEQTFARYDLTNVFAKPEQKKALGRLWRLAGQELMKQELWSDAVACFEKSLSYLPMNRKVKTGLAYCKKHQRI